MKKAGKKAVVGKITLLDSALSPAALPKPLTDDKKISKVPVKSEPKEDEKKAGFLSRLFKKPVNARNAKKKHKARRKANFRHKMLRKSLIKAGIDKPPGLFSKLILRTALVINIFIAVFLIQRYIGYFEFFGSVYVPVFILASLAATFLAVFFLLWIIFYLSLDLISYKRKVAIEEVLPDFLLLASANIRAGMPIDKALWYAVRPRFGVLAKEIEIVAKKTLTGEDLEEALVKFANKYDSIMLSNTVSLIIEGINAGGEIGGLLNKISESIQENSLLKKEMAAGISAYAIFISVSAIVVAPILFALSSQLLIVISEVTNSIEIPETNAPTLSFAGGGVGVSQSDFLIFAATDLFLTALISAMIISIIKKGTIKDGLKYIPIFTATALLIFFGTYKLFSSIFTGFI